MGLLNVGKQIGNLSESGRNIAGRATSTAMKSAADTSMGAGRKAMANPPKVVTKTKTSAIRNGVHPGSTAGWKGGKTTLLAHNDTGYMNKSYQRARYTDRRLKVPTVNMPISYNSVSSNHHTDFRIYRNQGDSPSILKQRGF